VFFSQGVKNIRVEGQHGMANIFYSIALWAMGAYFIADAPNSVAKGSQRRVAKGRPPLSQAQTQRGIKFQRILGVGVLLVGFFYFYIRVLS